jgi:hypothetical protein
MPRLPSAERIGALAAAWRERIPALPGRADLPHVPSGALVAGLLSAAFLTLGVLASAASDAAPEEAAAATRGGAAGSAHELTAVQRDGLPQSSGTGARIVYSVAQQRVWLVGADGRVRRRYQVTSGGTPAPGGTHTVFARRAHGTGGDGRQVEHAVFFAQTDGANVGFSAPVRPLPPGRLSAPARLGAAIRESRADGQALWLFATIGRTVEVIR